MNIYFLRHGETDENKNRYYYGKMDVSLNSNGIEQCKRAGEILKNISFDRIYVSDRKRTLQTANIVMDMSSVKRYSAGEIISDSRINEMCFGDFEGKTYEEIKETFPKECSLWERDWKNFSPPHGESYVDFFRRVRGFMDDILSVSFDNVLVVTHGGVIRTSYCAVLDDNLDFFWKFSSKNGDISLIKYEYGNIFVDSIIHV